MAILNYVIGTLLMHRGRLAFHVQDGPDGPHHSKPIESEPVDPVGMAMTITIICIYLILSNMLAYTILDVVAVLVMVEKVPTPFVVGEADEPLLAAEPLDLTSRPVTSGIRKTLTHLRAEAGILSAFRGLGYGIIYYFCEGFFNGLFIGLLRPLVWVFADVLVPVPVALLVWALNNAWVHKVISKPAQKNWIVRVNEQKRTRPVMGAISLWAFCRSISAFVTQTLANIFVLSKFTVVDDKVHFAPDASPRNTSLEALGIYALDLLLLLLLVVPASIILVRVQASLLPDTDEAIVPFDKTFGGKVDSDSADGHNQLAILDAWRSFGWPGFLRLLNTYVKYFFLQIALLIFCVGTLFVLFLAFVPLNDGRESPPILIHLERFGFHFVSVTVDTLEGCSV